MKNLNIFIPVYNRKYATIAFIDHLLTELLASSYSVNLWLLDDGSTDDTSRDAAACFPQLRVISLGGEAYWGGALEYIRLTAISYVSQLIKETSSSLYSEIFLVCNNDIRFKSGSLARALEEFDPSFAFVPSTFGSDFDPYNSGVFPHFTACTDSFPYYCTNTGKFLSVTDASLANLVNTYCFFASPFVWAVADAIPSSIPHYLSDYFLSHSIWRCGIRFRSPDGFICTYSTRCTNNKFATYTSQYSQENIFSVIKNFVYRKLDLLAGFNDPLSPVYSNANLEFRRRYAPLTHTFLIIFIHYLMRCLSLILALSSFKTTK